MHYLIYGTHSNELVDALVKTTKNTISHYNPQQHLRFCGLSMLEQSLDKHRPHVLVFDYSTQQQMQTLHFFEALDVVLNTCHKYRVIPVFTIPYSYNIEHKQYFDNLKTYCKHHNLYIIDCNSVSIEHNTHDLYSVIAKYIDLNILNYINNKIHTNIIYDTFLSDDFHHVAGIKDINVYNQITIKGKGHINGFNVQVHDPLLYDQFFNNKERIDIKMGKNNVFMNGGVLDGTFSVVLKNGNFTLKNLFYKGHIDKITIDDVDIQFKNKKTHTSTICNSLFNSDVKTVHPTQHTRAQLHTWATSVLERCENVHLSTKQTKNIIVIFSSTDRLFLTESKKQYLYNLAKAWNSELQIITNPLDVLTDEQYHAAVSFKSRRKNILNYVCKIVVVYNLLEKYDKVMWLDDTNIISPFAPNLFNVVPDNQIGALVIPRDSGFGDAVHDFKYILKHRNITIKDRYYNTGVMVIPKIYRDLFSFEAVLKDCDLFQSPYPTQCWQNYLMEVHDCNIFDISCMYNLMPCVYHYAPAYNEIIDLTHLYQDLLKYHIVHFTGFHKHRELLHCQFLQYSENVFDQKITIVVMNFKRSSNIKDQILPYYDNIYAVDEVIVVHCLKDTVFEYQSQKVKHVYEFDTDKEYGVFTRYIAAKKYANNKCVLFTDDDVIIPAKTISMVYQKWRENTNRVVGAEGRRIYFNVATQLYEYKPIRYHGDVDYLLTSCCMASYDNVVNVCEKEHVMSDYKNTTTIKWNGEDMYLCLTSSILHNTKCYSVDSPLVELDSGEHIISKVSSHVDERCTFLNLFFKRYTPLANFKPVLIEPIISNE